WGYPAYARMRPTRRTAPPIGRGGWLRSKTCNLSTPIGARRGAHASAGVARSRRRQRPASRRRNQKAAELAAGRNQQGQDNRILAAALCLIVSGPDADFVDCDRAVSEQNG